MCSEQAGKSLEFTFFLIQCLHNVLLNLVSTSVLAVPFLNYMVFHNCVLGVAIALYSSLFLAAAAAQCRTDQLELPLKLTKSFYREDDWRGAAYYVQKVFVNWIRDFFKQNFYSEREHNSSKFNNT